VIGDTIRAMSSDNGNSAFTKQSLREVADSAPKFGFSEIAEARFPREDLSAETIGLAYHVLRPGKKQMFAHRHEDAEEINVILSGGGRLKLDDEVIEIGPLDAIRIAPTVTRAFEAGEDGLEWLVFGPRHDKDGEILDINEFWG
jgi:mannose-6-phosphate isomerase-like protein (cupin superfamily)